MWLQPTQQLAPTGSCKSFLRVLFLHKMEAPSGSYDWELCFSRLHLQQRLPSCGPTEGHSPMVGNTSHKLLLAPTSENPVQAKSNQSTIKAANLTPKPPNRALEGLHSWSLSKKTKGRVPVCWHNYSHWKGDSLSPAPKQTCRMPLPVRHRSPFTCSPRTYAHMGSAHLGHLLLEHSCIASQRAWARRAPTAVSHQRPLMDEVKEALPPFLVRRGLRDFLLSCPSLLGVEFCLLKMLWGAEGAGWVEFLC